MDWMTAFSGTSGVPVLIAIFVIIITLAILAKKGLVSFQGKGLQIGDHVSNSTRIKQLQWDFLQAETEVALQDLPQEYLEEPKKWRTHYVMAKYRDVLELALINNNIIDDESYIESKQVLCYAAVLKATKDEYFRSAEYRNQIYKLTEKIIKHFYKIKKQFE